MENMNFYERFLYWPEKWTIAFQLEGKWTFLLCKTHEIALKCLFRLFLCVLYSKYEEDVSFWVQYNMSYNTTEFDKLNLNTR